MLNLISPPRRIEGYDISHQSGKDTVGSMVVFVNGTATRSEYRKFKVRTSTNDDLKSLREVIERRLKHKEWDFPNLILIDGGETQINAVLPLIGPYNIPIIGRSKSGDHSKSAKVTLVIPEATGSFRRIKLSSGDHVTRLIARVDEEAHRFAITYHSLLKRKNMLN